MYFTEHPADLLHSNRRFFDKHYQFFSERQDARVMTEFDLVQVRFHQLFTFLGLAVSIARCAIKLVHFG